MTLVFYYVVLTLLLKGVNDFMAKPVYSEIQKRWDKTKGKSTGVGAALGAGVGAALGAGLGASVAGKSKFFGLFDTENSF